MAVPRLAVDRPFTYLIGPDSDAGTGSLVSVSFHGRTVKGWILGPAPETPRGRLLPVRSVRSSIRFFDPRMLVLLRWMRERYVAPLATVIERSHPPRVAGEEHRLGEAAPWDRRPAGPGSMGALAGYQGAGGILQPGVTTWLRPLPGEEAEVCVAAVDACLASGRQAIVIVPEADPVPATAAAVLHRYGDRACAFLGGQPRQRYRAWLGIREGDFDVVVGTRPAVFAPVGDLGLIWISREVHPGHREDRAPYYHVREVATARARVDQAACVLASLSPSVETAVSVDGGAVRVARAPRAKERAAAPLVETAQPEAEDRSRRLGGLLKRARSAALVVSRRGYGLARVCRSCRLPAACAACRGPIVVERGSAACRVCGAPGVCANCGGRQFGVERGGTERIAEWASRVAGRAAELEGPDRPDPVPGEGRLVVGTAASVNDVGPVRIDLVAILDPDRALARAGLHAGEQALATWMEAAQWAGPRGAGGRVLLQSRHPGHPAVQALVRWEPSQFLLGEGRQRAAAGFVPGRPAFRVAGSAEAPNPAPALQEAGAFVVLTTPARGGTLCLVTVDPDDLPRFGEAVRALAAAGIVDRVEAEPQP